MSEIATADELDLVRELKTSHETLRAQIGRVIVGQTDVVDEVLVAIFCRRHALLVGAPGLAKTLLVSTIARALDLSFKRIQFTPDLMPSDITGTEVLEEDPATGRRGRRFLVGPIFANLVLADEINRTPPKTQAALLQAMQEQIVNAGNHSFKLDQPFFVLATQNPIEQEGTYPLPEAQLDRFMFLINVDYPTEQDELRIARETTSARKAAIEKVVDGHELMRFQDLVRRVPVSDHVYEYVVKLVRMSRPKLETTPEWIREWVMWGAGPRAVQYLVLGAKARAVMRGSYLVQVDDVNAVAEPVLAHRIITNFHAESEGITSREVIRRMIEALAKD